MRPADLVRCRTATRHPAPTSLRSPRLHFDSSARALLGDALALVNAVTLAIYGVLVQRVIPRHGATLVAGYAMIAGAITFAPLALVETARQDWSSVTAES